MLPSAHCAETGDAVTSKRNTARIDCSIRRQSRRLQQIDEAICCRWNADELTMNRNPLSDSIDLASEPDFALGNLCVRPSLREVSAHGQAEMLEPRVMQVLVAFSRQRGQVVSRDHLVARCWSGRSVGEDAVNRCVARIRRLSEARGGFKIETIARVGYRLTEDAPADGIAAANVILDEPATGHGTNAALPTSVTAIDARQARAGIPKRWRFVVGTAATALLVAIGVGLVTIFARPNGEHGSQVRNTPAPTVHGKPRLAVLPFQNLSPDATNAFFAEGMHAEVLSALAMRSAALEVIPRTTMMSYGSAPEAFTKVVADLGATHIVEGSIRREGDSVRLTVQLVDTRTQAYVWSQTYDRKLVNALSLQLDVAAEIVSQLAVAVTPLASKVPAPTASPEAYDFYLRAKLLEDDEDWEPAAALLTRALALDPSFGAAYVARALSHHFMIVDNNDDTEERLQLERDDIESARRLMGSTAPWVLGLEALYADSAAPDHARTIQRMEAAEAAGLTDSAAVGQHAVLLMLNDRLDESIVLLQSLAARDPGNILILMNLAAELGLAQRPVEALRVRNLTMERFPGYVFPLLQGRLVFGFTGRTEPWRTAVDQHREALNSATSIYRAHWDLLRFEYRYADLRQSLESVDAPSLRGSAITSGGFSLCCVGRRPTAVYRGWADLLNNDPSAAAKEGRSVLEFVANEPPTRWNKWFLRTLAAEGSLLSGHREQAITAARDALTLMPRKLDTLRSRYASAIGARVFAWAGAQDEAVALLEQLAVARPGLAPAEVTRDPLYFTPLARNARYQALVARLELQMKDYDAELRKANAVK